MDRNNIIGIVLIFVLFIVWQTVTAPSKEEIAEQQRVQDSIAVAERAADSLAQLADAQMPAENIQEESTVAPVMPDSLLDLQLAQTYGVFAPAAKGEAEEVTIQNNESIVTFSSKGGNIKSIELKHHFKVVKEEETKEDNKVPLKLLADEKNKFTYFFPIANLPAGGVSSGDLYYEVSKPNDRTVVFTASAGSGRYFQQTYHLEEEGFLMDYDVEMQGLNNLLSAEDEIELTWLNYLDKIEKNTRIEKINSTLYYKEINSGHPDHCKFNGNDTESTKGNPVKWVANSNQFFTSSLIAESQFARAEMESQTLDEDKSDLKRMESKIYLPFDRSQSSTTYEMEIYAGPNEFKRLYGMGHSMEDVIPYGWNIFGTINRWVVRPIFAWLSTFIGSKGIVILILTLIIKLALFPLTYRMLYSQSKMQALKPEIQKLKERFKDDSQKIQMETMKLYREFGANPLGSCLPMVLQLPIWFALYRFFPAAIDFRQEGFLWANDLSSYDEFIQLPFEIPLGFGSHISLFTVLWAVTTLLYTYYNSRHMDYSAQPAMKYMQYLMPVFFLGFFNSYASGLTAYLFFSNTINIVQTLVTKNYIIDQDKVKAEMEAHRKKPKKKGGFQERLQKALDEQRKVQEQQKKGKKK
ncbi:MAG TPA: membrane protein insertase YidC [Saprospiraceae bacterium]|nr:membrane protein insertase YidC [Saprospiraceae bacterium]